MLQTQVNYWTLVETKRHNLVSEDLGFKTLDETKRHNLASEQLGYSQLSETKRHNLVTEGQTNQSLGMQSLMNQETIRSHRANEAIGFQNAAANMVAAQGKAAQGAAALSQAATAASKFDFESGLSKQKSQWDYRWKEKELEQKDYQLETERIKAETGEKGLSFKGAEIGMTFMKLIPLIP